MNISRAQCIRCEAPTTSGDHDGLCGACRKRATADDHEPACKHGQLARSCEVCELQAALDRVIEQRDELWFDARDRYAQAALTGVIGARGENGRTPFDTQRYEQIVDAAFEIADLVMKRREKR